MPIMTEKDAKRGRRWVKRMRKKGCRVEFVGDETNKDLLKTGLRIGYLDNRKATETCTLRIKKCS